MKMNARLLKFLSLFLVLILTHEVKSQKIGLKVGLNLNNIAQDFSDPAGELSTKLKVSYHFGAIVDFELSDKFGIQPGLILSSKGFSYDDLSGDDYDRTRLNYLEIPLNARLNFSTDFHALFGPYLAFGLGGVNKYRYEANNDESKDGVDFGPAEVPITALDNDEFPLRALDYGLNIGLGYTSGPIAINLGYGLGLNNIIPNFTDSSGDVVINADDTKISNRVISISLTYFLGE